MTGSFIYTMYHYVDYHYVCISYIHSGNLKDEHLAFKQNPLQFWTMGNIGKNCYMQENKKAALSDFFFC